jgi:hypothetical protein
MARPPRAGRRSGDRDRFPLEQVCTQVGRHHIERAAYRRALRIVDHHPEATTVGRVEGRAGYGCRPGRVLSLGRCVVGKRHERRRYRYVFCLKFRTGTLLAASRPPDSAAVCMAPPERDANESAAGNVVFGDERCR